jgi:uncharacterized UBP type Zn finger protein
MLTMEDHIQSLISMGFIDRDLNRKLLIKANNDISEAVTLLTSYNYFNDDDDDIHIPVETTTTSPFISPLVSEQCEQQQQQAVGREGERKKYATKRKKEKNPVRRR